MAISETQLTTWSNPGAAVGSAETYQQIKAVLESAGAPYAGRQFEVYLQGSYGNNTNIWSESDVDIVIELKSAYIFNVDLLPLEQKATVPATFNGGITYGIEQFKQQVLTHLQARYGDDVEMGKRAINIKANGNRRSADVIVCMGYKQFTEYLPYSVKSLDGVLFYDSSGNEIVNYPKYHAANCVAKNQATGGKFKPLVRVFKNMRGKLIDDRLLSEGDAPSYFLEGMLWNVPDTALAGSYQEAVAKSIDWLNACDADQLLCANRMYVLLNPESPVTWRREKFGGYLAGAIHLWNNW